MSETRRAPYGDDFDEPEPEREPTLADLADSVMRKIVTAIVIAGALIALAIYMRPSPPRYQAAVGDGKIVRIDSKTGTVLACEGPRCYRVLRRGQHLEEAPDQEALPKQAAQPQQVPQAAPAPRPAPAPAPATR